MKKTHRGWDLLIMLCLALVLLPALGGRAQAADDIAANHTKNNGQPYYIMVNRAQNTVTVYGLDKRGYYTVPVKAMVCSVGREEMETVLGSFALTGKKREWCLMLDGSYGQYSSQFSGDYLFHSVCYSEADPGTLITEEYNMLGKPASMGCVRLQVADAKWIYDNCGAGTKVTVYDGEDPGPLGKPVTLAGKIPAELANGWDPTDPRAENPWRGREIKALTLDETSITLEAGMRQRLWPVVGPEGALYPQVTWTVEDPDVASVDEVGRVTGLREGTTRVTAHCGELRATCAVAVRGELLPFTDLQPGVWYYSDMRYAYEKGIFQGTGYGTIDPEGTMTRAAMIQVLYNMADRPQTWGISTGDHWLGSTLGWAVEMGLVDGLGTGLDDVLTRQELAVMLFRFHTGHQGRWGESFAELASFRDQQELTGVFRTAMSWAVGNGLLQGTSDNGLAPNESLPRCQAATVLRRYDEWQKK